MNIWIEHHRLIASIRSDAHKQNADKIIFSYKYIAIREQQNHFQHYTNAVGELSKAQTRELRRRVVFFIDVMNDFADSGIVNSLMG